MRARDDFDPGKAFASVRDRVRALPEFSEARASVIASATVDCRGRDVAGMRALGGFSALIERHINALPPGFHVDHGSRMFPFTIADALRAEVPAMREAVQAALSASASGAVEAVS